MNVHLFQYDIAWESPHQNHAMIEDFINQAAIQPGDLVVLPEMYATGFSLRTEATRDDDDAQLDFLSALARRLGATVIGGRTRGPAAGAPGPLCRNVASLLAPDGSLQCEYTKIHPFTFGREPERFAGGSEVRTARVGPFTVCPTVCYDLRFPEVYRAGLAKGADLFVVIANWPIARADHWRTLLVARAIENQAFVVGVNRCGRDPHLDYPGGSMVVSPTGHTLAVAGDQPQVVSCALDHHAVTQWRETFPAWRDRRLAPDAP